MDFTNTQPLLHAYIKYCARTLILRALVYVLVTFFVLFRIKTYISFFGRYFFVKSTNPVSNVYSTTPVEALLELLLLTRNPSLLVLKIYGKANFLKMLIDVDHDNLRTVLLQTPNTSHSYPF